MYFEVYAKSTHIPQGTSVDTSSLFVHIKVRQIWREQDSRVVNSLWPSDAICRHRSTTILAYVLVYCLTGQSHYLNQYWFIIRVCNVAITCPYHLLAWNIWLNYEGRKRLFGCAHLGQWPMTYLMTLSDWTISCQPWPPRARYGQWARYK